MEKIHENMCFDVVFLHKNMLVYIILCFTVFSPFSAHFPPPPLHHNGKGSIISTNVASITIIAHVDHYWACNRYYTFPDYPDLASFPDLPDIASFPDIWLDPTNIGEVICSALMITRAPTESTN